MASEIEYHPGITGLTPKAIVRIGTTRWSGSAFVADNTVAAASYAVGAVTLGEAATSDPLPLGSYFADMPGNVAGQVTVLIFNGTPVAGQQPDAVQSFYWNGSAIVRQTGDSFARIGAGGGGLTAILAKLSVAPIIVHSTTFTNDRLSMYSGDDYTEGTGASIDFRLVNYSGPTFEHARLSFAKGSLEDPLLSVEGVVTPDGADLVLTFELTRAQTADLGTGDLTYQIVRIDTDDEYTTLKEGRASLRRRIPFEAT